MAYSIDIGAGPTIRYQGEVYEPSRLNNNEISCTVTLRPNFFKSTSWLGTGYNIYAQIKIGSTYSETIKVKDYYTVWSETGNNYTTPVPGTGVTTFTFTVPSTAANTSLDVHLIITADGYFSDAADLAGSGKIGTIKTPELLVTKPGAPTYISISGSKYLNGYVAPGENFVVSWSGATNGINNQIGSYRIETYVGSNKKDTFTTTSGNYTLKLSDTSKYSRGNTVTIYIYAIGNTTVDGYKESSAASTSVKINRLPTAPSVSPSVTTVPYNNNKGGNVKFTITAGTDADGQTVQTYYATSSGGTKTLITSGTSLGVNANTTFYFYAYDGLEYSSADTVTVNRNTPPSGSLSVTGTNNGVGANVSCSITSGTTITNYKYRIYDSSNNLLHEISTTKNTLNISDIRAYFTNINQSGQAFTIKCQVTDSYDDATVFTNTTKINVPSLPTGYTLYNSTTAATVGNSWPTHFENNLTLNVAGSVDTFNKVEVRVYKDGSNVGTLTSTLINKAVTFNGLLAILQKSITRGNKFKVDFRFYSRYDTNVGWDLYSNSDCIFTPLFSVDNNLPVNQSGGVLTTTSYTATVALANNNCNTETLLNNNYSLTLNGFKQYELTVSGKTINSNYSKVEFDGSNIKLTIPRTAIIGLFKDYALDTTKNHTATLKSTITNVFGSSTTFTTSFTLVFTDSIPSFSSTNGRVTIKKGNNSLVLSAAHAVRTGDKLGFNQITITTYRGIERAVFQRCITGGSTNTWVDYSGPNITITGTKPTLGNSTQYTLTSSDGQSVEYFSNDFEAKFRLVVTEFGGFTTYFDLVTSDNSNVYFLAHRAPALSIVQTEMLPQNNGADFNFNLNVSDFGVNINAFTGTNTDKKYTLKINVEVAEITDLTTAITWNYINTPQDIVDSNRNINTNNLQQFTAKFTNNKTAFDAIVAKDFVQIKFKVETILIDAWENETTAESFVYGIFYNSLPTISLRKNHLGINTRTPAEDSIVDIHVYDDKNIIKFTLATDNQGNEQGVVLLNLKNGVLAHYIVTNPTAQTQPTRSLNLLTGEVNNFTIDGGTW